MISRLANIEATLDAKIWENGADIYKNRAKSEGSQDRSLAGHSLSHYTSISSLQKIIEGRKLFCTSCKHMNDKNELFQGLEIAKQEILSPIIMMGSAPKYRDSFERNDLIKEIVEKLEDSHFSECFAFASCFSESMDDNAQWQMYGGPHQGVSLEFRVEYLMKIAQSHNAIFSPCLYGYEVVAIRTMCGHALKAIIEAVDLFLHSSRSHNEKYLLQSTIRRIVFRVLAFLKGPEFRAEREWRIVQFKFFSIYQNDIPNDIGFHPSGYAMKPYVALNLNEMNEGRIGDWLSGIGIGPSPWASGNKLAVQMFLRKHNIWFDSDDSRATQVYISQSGLRPS